MWEPSWAHYIKTTYSLVFWHFLDYTIKNYFDHLLTIQIVYESRSAKYFSR